jgi:hypothetical protein
MLSDIVEWNDGGMIVRDGEIERITESVDGREPFAHAPMMTASRMMMMTTRPFPPFHNTLVLLVVDSEPREREKLDSKNGTSLF